MEWNDLTLNVLMDPGTKLGAIALGFFILFLALVLCKITTRILRAKSWVVGALKRKIDKTVLHYLVRTKNLLIFLAAAFIYASLVPGLRALAGTMVAGAGITALVLGFAAKSTLANLISGISLAVYRPIRIGDKVKVEGEYGSVEDITLRHTIIRTWQYRRLIIPNEKLDSMVLVNFSIVDPRVRCTVDMGVSYDTDIDLARRLILEEAMQCPHRDEKDPDPVVRVIGHNDFLIGVRLYLWAPSSDEGWLARFWILEHVKKRFDREGVEIPFPYRTLVYKKDMPPPRRQEVQEGSTAP